MKNNEQQTQKRNTHEKYVKEKRLNNRNEKSRATDSKKKYA